MFRGIIQLENLYLTGIDALEARRALGLPDAIELRTSTNYRVCERSVVITEEVARVWFGPQQMVDKVFVPLRLLMPEEIWLEESRGLLVISPAVSEERLLEIYVTAKIYDLHLEVERLRAENEALRTEIALLTNDVSA